MQEGAGVEDRDRGLEGREAGVRVGEEVGGDEVVSGQAVGVGEAGEAQVEEGGLQVERVEEGGVDARGGGEGAQLGGEEGAHVEEDAAALDSLEHLRPLRVLWEREAEPVPPPDAGVFVDCEGLLLDGDEVLLYVLWCDVRVGFQEVSHAGGDGGRCWTVPGLCDIQAYGRQNDGVWGEGGCWSRCGDRVRVYVG